MLFLRYRFVHAGNPDRTGLSQLDRLPVQPGIFVFQHPAVSLLLTEPESSGQQQRPQNTVTRGMDFYFFLRCGKTGRFFFDATFFGGFS